MKTLIKSIIPENNILYKLMREIYNFRFWHPKEWRNDILQDYADFKENVKFVQIGSSNGITADPITQFIKGNNWNGILVEPVRYIFEELKKNYSSIKNRLIFENCAIATENGKLKFYRLKKSDSEDLPFWYEQLGSLNKEVVLKHKDSIPNFDNLFIEDTVDAITFKNLVDKHSIKKIDFIQIDAEGYDYEILKMIPLSDFDVDFIMFENRHLPEKDYKQAIKMLKENGFQVGTKYKDTIAVKKEIIPFLKPSKTTRSFNNFNDKKTSSIEIAG